MSLLLHVRFRFSIRIVLSFRFGYGQTKQTCPATRSACKVASALHLLSVAHALPFVLTENLLEVTFHGEWNR